MSDSFFTCLQQPPGICSVKCVPSVCHSLFCNRALSRGYLRGFSTVNTPKMIIYRYLSSYRPSISPDTARDTSRIWQFLGLVEQLASPKPLAAETPPYLVRMTSTTNTEQSFRANLSQFRWARGSNNDSQNDPPANPFSRFYNAIGGGYIPLRSGERSNDEEAYFALSRWERYAAATPLYRRRILTLDPGREITWIWRLPCGRSRLFLRRLLDAAFPRSAPSKVCSRVQVCDPYVIIKTTFKPRLPFDSTASGVSW